MKKYALALTLAAFTLVMQGCAPDVGTEGWCANLKEKPKGDWSANEAKDFTKHCIL
ncbi:DUF3012 domain-containing protein [Aliamphritea ceti]|uniref:DUF3012 domain-containing protein n=1 Tax=Aliamphritea ceti TaxID=1524258 RepID=UPI0021C450F1|nr:DUF3012 domain-containing protein [Aliamphritea ceti]